VGGGVQKKNFGKFDGGGDRLIGVESKKPVLWTPKRGGGAGANFFGGRKKLSGNRGPREFRKTGGGTPTQHKTNHFG